MKFDINKDVVARTHLAADMHYGFGIPLRDIYKAFVAAGYKSKFDSFRAHFNGITQRPEEYKNIIKMYGLKVKRYDVQIIDLDTGNVIKNIKTGLNGDQVANAIIEGSKKSYRKYKEVTC